MQNFPRGKEVFLHQKKNKLKRKEYNMKTSKAITLVMMALALSATPALAQRGGGSRGGGGSHSSSMSSSRSSGGSHSSMSSSRSSSSSSRSSSFSSPSRSSSSSYSSPRSSSSSSTPRSSSIGMGSRSSSNSSAVRSSSSTVRGGSSVRSGETGRHVGVSGREAGRTSGSVRGEGVRRAPEVRVPNSGRPATAPAGATSVTGRPQSTPPNYARPGRPGGYVPPAARPIHPAPYFYHPWGGCMVHCHPIFWDPLPPRPWYWPGFWLYCNSYWYDYHVTDVVVVRDYVRDTYHVDMVTYGISGDIMYAIVRDGGETYLQVYDKDDHLLAEQKINRKYCNMVIDAENGGCWISKKNNKDALLFIWAEGQLLIYEAD